MMQAQSPQRELTGRHVLLILVAFFGVVAAVNIVMMRAAISTFAGLEETNPYRAGLAFNSQLADVAAQDARHWAVDARIVRRAEDAAELTITVREATGSPPKSVELAALLAHPANASQDHSIAMSEVAPGVFKGNIDAPPGQWDLAIDVSRDGETLFRSKNRITLH